jgi:hypothetical protein
LGGISVICGGLKSLWWATSMIIEFSLYSAVEKSNMDYVWLVQITYLRFSRELSTV